MGRRWYSNAVVRRRQEIAVNRLISAVVDPARVDAVRFGRAMRELRVKRGWRQEDLARHAGLSRGAVARVEQGRGDRLTIQTVERLITALGARFVWRIDWNGEALDRLLDQSHASVVELVVRVLAANGWLCVSEASFNVYGERGSIDVLAYHPLRQALLVVEVKSFLGDMQATLMVFDRKARLAADIARARGWTPRTVSKLLAIRDGSTARRRVREFDATLRSAFPDRSTALRRWLRRPTNDAIAGLLFLSPATHTVVRQRVARPRATRVREQSSGDHL
jgi:transcriptional regulator with XRE-family HTH domain